MDFPQDFNVKTGRAKNNHISLPHHIKTTSDFFRIKPLLCREVVPGDSMSVTSKTFVRMTSMPRPTFGHIKFHNRAFFVPYRLIMEGFTHFIEGINYPTSGGLITLNKVPYFLMSDVAEVLYDNSYVVSNNYYWRTRENYPDGIEYLVDSRGKVACFVYSNHYYIAFCRQPGSTDLRCALWNTIPPQLFKNPISEFGFSICGTFTNDTTNDVFIISDTVYSKTYNFPYTQVGNVYEGHFVESSNVDLPVILDDFQNSVFDFEFGGALYRFEPLARNFYDMLISLGYRVSFANAQGTDGYEFTDTSELSAGKLLAFVKVYLDYYSPAQYAQYDFFQMLFYGVSSSGRQITKTELESIATIKFCSYDRDYFTSAWQNPSGPNVSDPNVSFKDITATGGTSTQLRSRVVNYKVSNSVGDTKGTPVIASQNDNNAPGGNISYYMIETLRALTNFMRRHQLAGYRVIDRYLADRGFKISDDRVQRSYYLGTQSYDAEISDIMSTADTDGAPLGDYAGKGIAGTDQRDEVGAFKLNDCEEFGFIIFISTIVPDTGYVQGINRENLHLTQFDFFHGDFDNLGTQAIERRELFYDTSMKSPTSFNTMTNVLSPEAIWGFTPRGAEYKVGCDILSGDFAIPSRREGMDSFHLYRLFSGGTFYSIDRAFCIGENDQYDRIFNNTDENYDHFYMDHFIKIDAQRPMKSLSDVYDFEHCQGHELNIPANGTTLN